MAAVLQQIVAQLDTLTLTMAAMEERLVLSEDCGRRLEAAMAAQQAASVAPAQQPVAAGAALVAPREQSAVEASQKGA